MAEIRWSSQARRDLESIADYYRNVSASYAERFEEQIFAATRRLEVFPRSGRTIPEAESVEGAFSAAFEGIEQRQRNEFTGIELGLAMSGQMSDDVVYFAEYGDNEEIGCPLSDLQVEIQRDLDAQAGVVEMVPQEIGRVLLNLLGNAFDAVHAYAVKTGGDYAPTVTVSTQQVDGQVAIRVSDNGPGIPAEIRDRIFEPFFTTKPTGTGTGLGLSLSYDIVMQGHGGTLRVESEKGQGATFIVTLPMNQTEAASTP